MTSSVGHHAQPDAEGTVIPTSHRFSPKAGHSRAPRQALSSREAPVLPCRHQQFRATQLDLPRRSSRRSRRRNHGKGRARPTSLRSGIDDAPLSRGDDHPIFTLCASSRSRGESRAALLYGPHLADVRTASSAPMRLSGRPLQPTVRRTEPPRGTIPHPRHSGRRLRARGRRFALDPPSARRPEFRADPDSPRTGVDRQLHLP